MNKVPLIIVLSSLLIAGTTPSFGQANDYCSEIEQQANRRAQTYVKDIQHVQQGILNSKQSQETTQMTTELGQRFNPKEPLRTHLKKVSHVVVFLSFSMSTKSLEAWLLQCNISGATPVIRGLINNSFKDTMAAIKALSKQSGIGMQIDPILFNTFSIQQVPAVVYVKDTPDCPSNMDCMPVVFDVIYGDVSLHYALGKLNEAQPLSDRYLISLMSRLQGGLQ